MSLVAPFSAVVVLLLVFVPAFWIISRLFLRTSTPTVWLRGLLVGLWGVAGVSYAVLLAVGAGDLAQSTVGTYTPIPSKSIIGDFVSQLAITLGASGVTLGTYASLVPAIRDVREIDLPISTALLRLGRYTIAFAVLFSTVLVLLLGALSAGGSTIYWVFLFALIGIVPLTNTYLIHLFRQTRPPETAERQRLSRLSEQAGLSVKDVVILDDADETAEIHVRGIPTRRQLFVSEHLLEAFDDETLQTIFAIQAGKLRVNHRGITVYPLLGFLVVAVGALLWGSASAVTAVILLALLIPLPTLWVARRALYRADDYASEIAGTKTVVESLERVADEQNIDIVRGGVLRVVKSRPPLGRRISRLRGKS